MKRISNNVLLLDMINVAQELEKKTLTVNAYEQHGAFTCRPFIRAFGTWNNALYAAGLEIGRIGRRRKSRKIDVRMRHIVMKRDRFRCVLCGASPAKNLDVELHVDHIIPFSKGGLCVIENLQTLCSLCNFGKSDI